MFKRILLKVSGEALAGNEKTGIDTNMLQNLSLQIKKIFDQGIQIAITTGGGNFWRGRNGYIKNKVAGDHMGMIATALNAIALCDSLEQIGLKVKIMSPIEISSIVEKYNYKKARELMEKGFVLIFCCGTGNPFFTTDSGAVLKAIEIEASVILMAKNVDGIYDSDPKINKNAKKFSELSYEDIIKNKITVMDIAAVILCKEHDIPIMVFALKQENSIYKAAVGEKIGSIVKGK